MKKIKKAIRQIPARITAKTTMKQPIFFSGSAIALLLLTGCSTGDSPMLDKSLLPCGDKPNCVSTQDPRAEFNLAKFELTNSTVSMDQIKAVALTLPGARLASESSDYLHIECVSKIMRFVDDLELRKQGDFLIVRSSSRVGYSDLGVNRKRAEELRKKLIAANLIRS